jgi:hypothetical protein
MKEVNPPSVVEIKIELSRMSFERNAISNLSYLLKQAINLLTPYSNSVKYKDVLPDLNYLLSSLEEIHTYREDQQQSIFEQIVQAFQEILLDIQL